MLQPGQVRLHLLRLRTSACCQGWVVIMVLRDWLHTAGFLQACAAIGALRCRLLSTASVAHMCVA